MRSVRSLSKSARQEWLANLVFTRGSVRIDGLHEELGVSVMTLYRDLADLEARHVVVRSRGEVSATASSLSETPFAFRLGQEPEAKGQVAGLAADLVARGDSLFVDDSTTAHAVLRQVLGRGPTTVVTNCQPQAQFAIEQPETELILVGGRYLRPLQAFYGPAALDQLAGLRVDVAVMGAAAVQAGAVHHPYEDVADFKRAVVGRATTSVLALTAAKTARSALYEVSPLTDFDVIVTDLPADDAALSAAVGAGVEIVSTR